MKKLLVGLLSPFTFSLNDALVIMATGASLIFPNLCLAQYNIIYNFPATTVNGETPYGSLTRVGPVLYGMTEYGGAKGVGSIFSMDTNGNRFTNLFYFDTANGQHPKGSLVISGNVMYGMAYGGGANNDGLVFSIHTDGTGFTDLLDFNGTNGEYPYGDLTLSGNNLYGMTSVGGAHNNGLIFTLHTNGSGYADLLDFNSTNGANPEGSLLLSGGKLYGMASQGGAHIYFGCAFSLDTNGGGYKDLYDFDGYPVGDLPFGSLIISGNKLFGMTNEGGNFVYGYGALFSIDTGGGGYTNIVSFSGAIGKYPYGSLTLSGGTLYGMTLDGENNGLGNVFSVDTDGTSFKNLVEFGGTNGEYPYGNVILAGNKLYGMASAGGPDRYGLIFSVNTSGTGFTDLFDFAGGTSPARPGGSLIISQHTLFGMTGEGGSKGLGNIFSLDTIGDRYYDIMDFNGANGANPMLGYLTLAANKIYGMTSAGGLHNDGVIFSTDTINGSEYRVLHSFNDTAGSTPYGSLTLVGSKLYGMTYGGGTNGYGVIFSMDTIGTGYTVLVNFDGYHGQAPFGSLTLSDSLLYGMTYYGGSNDVGVIFSLDTNGTGYKVLLHFDALGNNLQYTKGSLTVVGDKLYGMTQQGGSISEGNAFYIYKDGTGYTNMGNFGGTFEPEPCGDLTLYQNKLYGMSLEGGIYVGGDIISVDTNVTGLNDEFDFDGTNGGGPTGSLTLAGSEFYGMTPGGGTNGNGIVFGFSTNISTSVSQSSVVSNQLSVFPNPNNGEFSVICHSEQSEESQPIIKIYNVLGENVLTETLHSAQGDNLIELGNEPEGVYLYRVISENGELIGEGKLIIQK
jgi:uncharacterized repeat protein (TIGR03803 family)